MRSAPLRVLDGSFAGRRRLFSSTNSPLRPPTKMREGAHLAHRLFPDGDAVLAWSSPRRSSPPTLRGRDEQVVPLAALDRVEHLPAGRPCRCAVNLAVLGQHLEQREERLRLLAVVGDRVGHVPVRLGRPAGDVDDDALGRLVLEVEFPGDRVRAGLGEVGGRAAASDVRRRQRPQAQRRGVREVAWCESPARGARRRGVAATVAESQRSGVSQRIAFASNRADTLILRFGGDAVKFPPPSGRRASCRTAPRRRSSAAPPTRERGPRRRCG